MMGHSTTRKVLKSHGLITSYYVCIPNHLPLKTNKTRTWELNFPTIWELWVARVVPICYRVILGFYQILRARCLVCVLRCVLLFVISWTVTARFLCLWSFPGSKSGLPFPTPGDLPDPGLHLRLLCLVDWQVGSLALHHLGSPTSWWTASLYILK